MQPILCDLGPSFFLIFSDNVPQFIYYTHGTALILSLIVSFFIFLKNRKPLISKILFWSLVPFQLWVFFNIVIWATNRSDLIMFLWSLQIMIEPMTYIGMLYLLYVFVNNKDVGFKLKLITSIIYLPLIIITPTIYSLSGFHLPLCIPDESYYAYYTYVLELISVISIIAYSFISYKRAKDVDSKKKILYLSSGIVLFLLAFASGNIFGSFTDDWITSQFGLFGTPIFVAFIAYLIVKYKTFNIKLIGTQALVVALWVALFATLFVTTIEIARVIVSLTLILFLVIGILLIRSVLREVKQREQIAKMAEDVRRAYEVEKKANAELEKLDKVKDQFLMTTQHNLRTPLTSMMGYSDLLLNGTFGKQNKKTVEVIKKFQVLSRGMIKMVNDFLDMAQFQLGRDVVSVKPNVELEPILSEIMTELQFKADSKGLYLKMEKPEKIFKIQADREKIKAALFNIVDNAIKYTPKGGVTIEVKNHDTVKIIVSDTGIGIPKDKVDSIFSQMFQRGEEAKKVAAIGSGVGLYLSGQIIKSHKGKVWVESEVGKGSVFHIELPLSQEVKA